MNSNKFELIGNANYIDTRATEKGGFITKILLGIYLGRDKEGKSLYESVEVTLFGETAERFADEIKKKDSVYLEGRISVNKYKNKEGIEVSKTQFIANSYTKVSFDKDKKAFVAENENLPWGEK